MEVGQADTLRGESIHLRRLEMRIAETAETFVTHVIDQDDDDVRASCLCGGGTDCRHGEDKNHSDGSYKLRASFELESIHSGFLY